MADSKTTALTAATSLSSGDLLYAVIDPAGTPLSRKITVDNLFGALPNSVAVGWADTLGTRVSAGLWGFPSVQIAASGQLKFGPTSGANITMSADTTSGTMVFLGTSAGSDNADCFRWSLPKYSRTLTLSNAGTLTANAIQCSLGLQFGAGGGGLAVGVLSLTSAAASAPDVFLYRDSAGVFYQRNGANAQSFLLSGTYTDSSNYRRLSIASTTGGVFTLSATGAGSGASGNVLHITSLPTSNPGPGILWNNAGTPAIGT